MAIKNCTAEELAATVQDMMLLAADLAKLQHAAGALRMPTDQEAPLTFFQSSIDRTDKSVVTKEKAVEERYDRSGHLVIRGLPQYYRCHGGLRTTVLS